MKPRILLTGKSGQLGYEFARLLPEIAEVTALDRAQLDLSNVDEIRRLIGEIRPAFIVNAAAYTAVDQAESDEAAARGINEAAPRVLAEEAKKIAATLIHFSTDYVFDGSKREPYLESDPTRPLNVYGETKLAGEEAIRASGVAHLIFRTSWLYSPRGKNFLLTILRLASQKKELRIVSDQVGAPTSAREAALTVTTILKTVIQKPAFANQHSGTYHLSAAGETNWHEFAEMILQFARRSHGQRWINAATKGPFIVERITPIKTEEYPTPARRPHYSVLSNAKLNHSFAIELPDWWKQLEDVFAKDA